LPDWLYYPNDEIINLTSHCFLHLTIAGSEDRISADGGVIAGPPTPCPGGSGGLAGSSTLSSSALSIDSGGGSTSTISASGLPSSTTLITNGDGGAHPVGGGAGSHHGGGTSGLNGSLMSSIAGLANGKHHHNGDLNHLAATKLASLGIKMNRQRNTAY
jgi:hypothetical protein